MIESFKRDEMIKEEKVEPRKTEPAFLAVSSVYADNFKEKMNTVSNTVCDVVKTQETRRSVSTLKSKESP
jgi:hypothetical protein